MAAYKGSYGESEDAKLIAYQNAYRLKKKALISTIERSLRLGRGEPVPQISRD